MDTACDPLAERNCRAVQCADTCTLWRYGPWRTLTSVKTVFHSSLLRAFPLQPLILILLRSSSTSSSHHIFGLPTLLLPSGLLIYSFLMTLSSDIFLRDPSQSCFLWLSNSWYSAISSLSWASRFHCHTLVHRFSSALSSAVFEDFSRHWLWDTKFQNHR
jgi:hypothetical protein